MSIVYVPPPDYGLDRLFDLGMAKLKNKQALEELMKRHELEMDQKNAEWGREDSVKQADRQYENSVLQGALGSSGGGSPGMGASIPGRGPSPGVGTSSGGPSPAGGIPGLMNRSPISAPPLISEALRGAIAAGGNIGAVKAAMDMFSSATGIDLQNKASIAAMQQGLADGMGMGAYSPLINPDGFTFRPADQTELKNKLDISNIAADASRYAAELGLKGQQATAGASIFSSKVREKLGLKENDLGWAVHNEGIRQFNEQKGDRAADVEYKKALAREKNQKVESLNGAPLLGVDIRPDAEGYYSFSDAMKSQQGQAILKGLDTQGANNLISNNSDSDRTSDKTFIGHVLREFQAMGYKIRVDVDPEKLAVPAPADDMFGGITPEEIADIARRKREGK